MSRYDDLLSRATRTAAALRLGGWDRGDATTTLMVTLFSAVDGYTVPLDPQQSADLFKATNGILALNPDNPSQRAKLVQYVGDGAGEPPIYAVVDGRICRLAVDRDEDATRPLRVERLCDFDARIVRDVAYDDGVTPTRHVEIAGRLADSRPLPRITIPAAEFEQMKWPVDRWGTAAIVSSEPGARNRLREAIQTLSVTTVHAVVYTHTGWRKVGSRCVYLHGGGAIGPNGAEPNIEVQLPEALRGFDLPVPPDGDDLRTAVRASLGLLDVAPDRITVPLLATVYRAALGTADFSVFLVGPTGNFKSELTALVQQHFGAGMDARHLPASWESTDNALEALAFAAKDALFTIDDFKPKGSGFDVSRLHAKADRVLRDQGNSTGRSRLNADSTLQATMWPRGLILASGEDAPNGESLRARMVLCDVEAGDVDRSRLTAAQRDAGNGRYAAAIAGYLRWLASRYESVQADLQAHVAAERARWAGPAVHPRTAEALAHLSVGAGWFLDFADECGAITADEQAALLARVERGLDAARTGQGSYQQDANPARQYLDALNAALTSGQAHLTGLDGGEPGEPLRWGWRPEIVGVGPRGSRIGWVDGDTVYLQPGAAYAAAQQMARKTGQNLVFTERAIGRHLYEAGLLVESEKARGGEDYTVRRMVEGTRKRVLYLDAAALDRAPESDEVPVAA